MRRLLVIAVGCYLVASFSSCRSNRICPSFESAYLLDDEIQEQTFSLFDQDTLPIAMDVKKNKYGLIKKVSYRKKQNSINTIAMETVYPQVEELDTTLLLAERDPGDEIDLSEPEQRRNKYNVDQIYYMRHFGQYLPMPEEPSLGAQSTEEADSVMTDATEVKKKKWWQFWKKKAPKETNNLDEGEGATDDDDFMGEEGEDISVGEEDTTEEEPRELTKKEIRQQEKLEAQKQAELEKKKELKVVDISEFEKGRREPAEEKKVKTKKPKGEKKKLKINPFKKKQKEAVELKED
ncbi:MAG: hypothetical protein ACR2MX_04345 [Cyclobacteriaceae bacterium]